MARTCLIVDDSKIVRKLARRVMEALAFECSEAEDGAQALAACKASMPEFILLDWHMPVMNGLEFIKALRNDTPGGRDPKVMFCTTENDINHIMEAIAAGADEYVMKPFDEEIIRGKLTQIGVIEA